MERAYREDELLDAVVIDSEGYIYGKVGKIIVKEDELYFSVYEPKPDEKTVLDMEALRSELLKRTKQSFAAKLQRISSFEVLMQNVRKELALKPEEPLIDEHYVKYAERLGNEIPQRKSLEERKEPKGTVTFSEVSNIGISSIGSKDRSSVIKIILLKEQKEARFRKIPTQKTPSYRSSEILRDKLVVDSDGFALGYVDSVVLFRHVPGIRVYVAKPSDSVSLNWLFRYLEGIDRPDIIEELKRYFGTESDSRIYHVTMDDLGDFMEKTKLTFRVPESALYDQQMREFVSDVPWTMISKVGDVILLNLTTSELKSKAL